MKETRSLISSSTVGKLVAVGAEELDAVVLPGIVAGGDDHAGSVPVLVGEVGDAGSGDDAGAFKRDSGLGKASGERGSDPAATWWPR